jgi:hypothetical protein
MRTAWAPLACVLLGLGCATSRPQPDVPPEVRAQTDELSRQLEAVQTEFFADPRIDAVTSAAPVRSTFLGPDLARPRWSLPGPVTIEKLGTPDVPRYRYSAIVRADDGAARESTCDFLVERCCAAPPIARRYATPRAPSSRSATSTFSTGRRPTA